METWTCRFEDQDFYFEDEVAFFFKILSDYMCDVEKFINREIERIQLCYESYASAIEEGEFWEGELAEASHSLFQKTYLKQIVFDSLVVTLYSFLEKKMKSFCERFEINYSMQLKDTKGKGIFKYRRYLTIATNIDFQTIDKEWKNVILLNKIRNKIIHSVHANIFSKDDQSLINSLKSFKGITVENINDNYQFTLTTISISQFSEAVYQVLEHICYKK